MREIKFRAWDKRIQEMTDFRSMPFYITDIEVCWDEFDFMQFTGLKDKNGKEIYEGDVVQGSKCGKCAVEYWDGQTIVSWNLKCLITGDTQSLDSFDEYEVIGNIYENPELLEVDKT